MKKIYVDYTNQITVICPKCGLKQNKNVFKFKDSHKRIKAKCKCGEVFRFTLDFRKYYRKNVQLAGEYYVQEKDERGEIVIEDISKVGIRFSSLKPNHISRDDLVELKFTLDAPMEMEVRTAVKIKWVVDNDIGGLFLDPDLIEYDMGFYLKG